MTNQYVQPSRIITLTIIMITQPLRNGRIFIFFHDLRLQHLLQGALENISAEPREKDYSDYGYVANITIICWIENYENDR